MKEMNDDIRLGKDLLDTMFEITNDPDKMERYNAILSMPGVDGALYMLYENKSGFKGHPRPLLQSAFMLGYYLNESINNADHLWDSGPEEKPG